MLVTVGALVVSVGANVVTIDGVETAIKSEEI